MQDQIDKLVKKHKLEDCKTSGIALKRSDAHEKGTALNRAYYALFCWLRSTETHREDKRKSWEDLTQAAIAEIPGS